MGATLACIGLAIGLIVVISIRYCLAVLQHNKENRENGENEKINNNIEKFSGTGYCTFKFALNIILLIESLRQSYFL